MNFLIKNFTKNASIFTIVAGCFILAGWVFNIPAFKSVLPGIISIKFNTALCFILSGIALYLMDKPVGNQPRKTVAFVCAWIVLLMGFLNFSEYILGRNLGIDELFWKEGPGTIATTFPGRMSLSTSLNFTLLGLILLMLGKRKYHWPIQALLIAMMPFPMLVILNYLSGVSFLNSLSHLNDTALYTAILFLVICLGIFSSSTLGYLHFSFMKKIVGFFIFILLIRSIIFFAINKNIKQSADTEKWQENSHEVLLMAERVNTHTYQIQSLAKDYIITGEENYLPLIDKNADSIGNLISHLNKSIKDNAGQQLRIDSLQKHLDAYITSVKKLVNIRRNEGFEPSQKVMLNGQGKILLYGVSSIIKVIQQEESQKLIKHKAESEKNIHNSSRILTLFQVIAFLLMLAALKIIYNNVLFRNKVEEEIKKNNIFLETILENIPNMVFVKEADELRFARINKAGENFMAISRKDLIDKNDHDFFPKEQADFFTAKDREVLYQRNVTDIPEEIITTPMGERWLHTKKIPVFHSNGMPLYIVGISEDITEKKMANDKMQQATQQIFDLYNNAPCGYHSLDINGSYIDINDTELKWLGYRREEVIGKLKLTDIITPESKQKFQQHFSAFKQAGFVNGLELDMVRKDGTIFPIILSGSLIYDEKGNYVKSRSTIFDYTERKILYDTIKQFNRELEQKVKERTEELSNSEKRFRALIENSSDVISLADKTGKIVYVSPVIQKITGFTTWETLTKKRVEIIYQEDRENVQELFKQVLNNPGVNHEYTLRLNHKDGGFIWVEGNVVNLFHQESIKAIVINYHDITERKKAEKAILDAELRYRTLFEQSPDGISVIDVETFLPLEFNEKNHTQLGYSRKEFSQLKISDYEIIDSPEVIKTRAEKIMREGQDSFETRHKTKNGDIRDVQVTILKITFHDKPVLYTIFRDITEKRKLEKELKQQEINLQRQITEATIQAQEKERNELGRELHDNINQILATVKMYLGMAKAKENFNIDLLGQSYEYVNEAMEEIRKLSHSLVAPSLGDIGLPEVLEELVQITNVPNGLQVQLVNEIDNGQMIDDKKELMLYRIVQEQMNNIHKHAQAKIVIIHLKKAGNNLHLSIADDGVGFNSTQKVSGIGIKNIQSRVEFYSGKVNIISAPGKGCILEISIPF
jgi:PAS domain S-box-containing protein